MRLILGSNHTPVILPVYNNRREKKKDLVIVGPLVPSIIKEIKLHRKLNNVPIFYLAIYRSTRNSSLHWTNVKGR